MQKITLFPAILSGLGLSQSEAADYLGVRLDTVKSWSAGRNRAKPAIYAELHVLEEKQRRAAEAIVSVWRESGENEKIEFAIPPDPEIRRRGWPSRGAFVSIARCVWQLIGDRAQIDLVASGSTDGECPNLRSELCT